MAFALCIQQFAYVSDSTADQSNAVSVSQEFVCIDSPWAYESLGKTVGAAFMAISSTHDATDELIGATSPEAGRVEIHNIIMKAGNMVMTPVDNLELSPESPLELKPHGVHIMLMGLNKPLEADTTFPLTLEFRKSGMIRVQVSVRKISDSPPDHKFVCN